MGEVPPYDKAEWQRIAQKFLTDKSIPPSALESAYIALRADDPKLAEMCKSAVKDRRRTYGK